MRAVFCICDRGLPLYFLVKVCYNKGIIVCTYKGGEDMHTMVDYTKARGLLRKEETELLVEFVESLLEKFKGRIGLFFVSGYEEEYGNVLCSSTEQIDTDALCEDTENIKGVVTAINNWFDAVELGEDETFPKITFAEKTVLVSVVVEESILVISAKTLDMQNAFAMAYGVLHAIYLVDTLKAYVRAPAKMLKADIALASGDLKKLSMAEEAVDEIFSNDENVVLRNWLEWRDDMLGRGLLSQQL